MPAAEIISIGTELLLGEILDTNSPAIASALREIGVDVYRTSTVGDNQLRITRLLQESIQRAEMVITTGGLGPTVGDTTREGIAQALEREARLHNELWKEIVARFRRFDAEPTENNRSQAFLPEGAVALPNPRGTAPGVYLALERAAVFAMPGVPEEMELMLKKEVIPRIKDQFQIQSTILTRVIHTKGIGESRIDALLEDLEKLSNPTVGLAAKQSHVLVRLAAKAENPAAADELLDPLEAEIRQRLGDWIEK